MTRFWLCWLTVVLLPFWLMLPTPVVTCPPLGPARAARTNISTDKDAHVPTVKGGAPRPARPPLVLVRAARGLAGERSCRAAVDALRERLVRFLLMFLSRYKQVTRRTA